MSPEIRKRTESIAGPLDSYSARRQLEEGNAEFVHLVDDYYRGTIPQASAPLPRWVNVWGGPLGNPGSVPKQQPFATVVACSDARVPVRALFNCNANELFEIRVAGNVLADECLGSIDYALAHLTASMKALVVMGHTACGAVTAAADAYLNPNTLTASSLSIGLRSIVHRLLGPVRRAAFAIERILGGPPSGGWASRRQQLIDASIFINAALAAHELRTSVDRAGISDVRVFYGIYDLATCRVFSLDPDAGLQDCHTGLAEAPPDAEGLARLSDCVAAKVVAGPMFS